MDISYLPITGTLITSEDPTGKAPTGEGKINYIYTRNSKAFVNFHYTDDMDATDVGNKLSKVTMVVSKRSSWTYLSFGNMAEEKLEESLSQFLERVMIGREKNFCRWSVHLKVAKV